MNDINNGGPAFPEAGLSGLPNGEFIHGRSGMTLRDYFAAKAMQGMLSDPETRETCPIGGEDRWTDSFAATCYQFADAMLKARTAQEDEA